MVTVTTSWPGSNRGSGNNMCFVSWGRARQELELELKVNGNGRGASGNAGRDRHWRGASGKG